MSLFEQQPDATTPQKIKIAFHNHFAALLKRAEPSLKKAEPGTRRVSLKGEMCGISNIQHVNNGFSCAQSAENADFLETFQRCLALLIWRDNALFLTTAETIRVQQARRPCSSYLFRISIPALMPEIKKPRFVRLLTRW
ncbi:hypothetical protein ACSHJY_001092 [Cronobacter sakazakii]|uniref:hypothetical protein n=1 Tax=Cronobacter sakazakii TaxID=28141 RepID=UPI0028952DED|nr:hypothetical protein [Cronobacter sakazakii]MDT3572748.1 hypothetical protein [Cronobacter sakazakii]